MRFVCIFVAALGLAAAYPKNDVVGANAITQFLENPDEGESLDFEALILSMLERFRQTMITGSETLPVLDPFQLDRLSIDDQTIPLPGLRMTLEDLEVRKLSTFEINSLTFDIISVLRGLFGLSIDGEVPLIALDAGKYDLSVTALGFTIYGNGEAKIRVIRPRIKATLLIHLNIREGMALNLQEADVAISLEGFQTEITGIFNDPVLSEFVSRFLGNLVPELLEVFETEINEIVTDIFFEIAQDIIKDLDLGGILG